MKKKTKEQIFRKLIHPHIKKAYALLEKHGMAGVSLFHIHGEKLLMHHRIDLSDMHPQLAFIYLMTKPVKTEHEIEVYRSLLQTVMETEMATYFKETAEKLKFPGLGQGIVGPTGQPLKK